MASFFANLLSLVQPGSPQGAGNGGGSAQSGGRPAASEVAKPKAPSYSFAQLQQLYNKLSEFRESDLEKGAGDAVVETVRQITEALIWGEQNDTNFFDFFCEKSILADFIRVLGLMQAPKEVKVQLLQTLSMLVQNIRRQTSVYYLLSGNYVNKLIAIPLDFNDEEILAYYITLLKSLAMRLDSETVKFFFIQHPDCSFPLYIEAAKFFSHRDQMVRAAVRTITLQVYRVDDKAMQRYVLHHARETYFHQLVSYLRDLWRQFNTAALEASVEEDLSALTHRNDLQQDLLVYLSDVFELEVRDLNEVLCERLLSGIMLPLLLPSIARVSQTASAGGSPSNASIVELGGLVESTQLFQPSVALFLLRQVLDTCHCTNLIEPIASALLSPRVAPALAQLPALAQFIMSSSDGSASYPEAPFYSSSSNSGGDSVPNPLREDFLRCLRSSDEPIFLLAAAVVHSCLTKSCQVLSQEFLEKVQILPGPEIEKAPRPSDVSTVASSSALVEKMASSSAGYPVEKEKVVNERKSSVSSWLPSRRSSNKSAPSPPVKPQPAVVAEVPAPAAPLPPAAASYPQGSGETQISMVLNLLLQGVQRHASWQLQGFQVFVRILLDVFLDPSICHHAKSQVAIQETLEGAVKSSAQMVRRLLQGCQPAAVTLSATAGSPSKGGGAPDDSLLDLMLEEWELHKAPLARVSDMCNNPRCLLPSGSASAAAVSPHGVTAMRRPSVGNSVEKHGQKAIRNFFLLRRLMIDLERFKPKVPRDRNREERFEPWIGTVSHEPLPVQVDEEVACGFSENMNMEVGSVERIVCSLATSQGKQTRYLLLHDYWLLLVQPDLTMMGWAVVKTVWPLRSVQSLIDRSDPRTLRIGMHALRGTVGSGEATMSRPEAGDRPSIYLTLTLNFEDVKRCHSADRHLQKRRQEVRSTLMTKAISFVYEHCQEKLPRSLSGEQEKHSTLEHF